jgi:transcriptional regulator of acetoin/glycerol metabolism
VSDARAVAQLAAENAALRAEVAQLRAENARIGELMAVIARLTERIADSLELFEGACWREDAVGTNAAGTALIERRGLLCIANEHYVASHYPFACAATPLYVAIQLVLSLLVELM